MSRFLVVVSLIFLFTLSLYAEGFRLAVSDSSITQIMNETCNLYNGTAQNATVTFKQDGTFDYEFETSMMGERKMKFSGDTTIGSDGKLQIRFKKIISNGSSMGFIALKIAMNNLVKETNRIAQASGALYRVEQFSQSGYKGCVRVKEMNTSLLPGVKARFAKIVNGYILLSDSQPSANVKGSDIEFRVSDQLVNKVVKALIPQFGSQSELSDISVKLSSQGAATNIKAKDGKEADIVFSASVADLNTVLITPVLMEPQDVGQEFVEGAPSLLNAIIGSLLKGRSVFSIQDGQIKGSFTGAVELPGNLKSGLSAIEFGQGNLTVGILVQ